MSDIFPDWYAQTASSWTFARAKRFASLLGNDAGSPIEVLFGASLLVAAYETDFPLAYGEDGDAAFQLKQQVRINKYRVDFVISGEGKKLVVECDGREFHHSTREQIERDRARDAELSGLGYTIFRYPGTQIQNDIWKVVFEVLNWLDAGQFAKWYHDNREFL